MMKTLLIHNATAGVGDHDRLDLLSAFKEAGHEPFYCSTRSDTFPDILDEPFEAIAIAGGDGTIRKVATRLKRHDIPLIILPLGTANNIARSLGLELQTMTPPPANAVATTGRKLDLAFARLGSEEARPVVEGIGMGALAATMDKKVGKGEEGTDKIMAARQTVAKLLSKAKPFKATVTLDGRAITGEFLSVEVVLHRYSGPALPLCPPADSGDDALDLVLVDEERRDEMVAWVTAPENSDPPVRIERGRRAVLEWSQKPALRLDDKQLKLPSGVKSIEMRIQDQSLRVLVAEDHRPESSNRSASGRSREDA